MVRLDTLNIPITDDDLQELGPVLASLQGNILSWHGRDNAVHLFLRFQEDKKADVRKWICSIAEAERVTSALKQREQSAAWKQDASLSFCFCSFFLSAEGYRYLAPPLVAGFSAEFQDGMKCAKDRVGDPEVVVDYTPFHAMVLLAHQDSLRLAEKLDEMRKELDPVIDLKYPPLVERGKVLWEDRPVPKKRVEHFGYADGISQPLFFQKEVEEELDRGKQQGRREWDPSAGPSLVLIRDPNGGEYDYGSYLVFRKLEQNVKGFVGAVETLAGALRLDAYLAGTGVTGADLAGAFAIGRFRDGTPVVLQNTPGRPDNGHHNFSFSDDPQGGKCPYHAHIRKLNPRDDASHARGHRIVRRGIPYGERRPGESPAHEVGLLFMCYQRDIKRQFEFLQSRWANNTNFLRESTGVDPIIGRTTAEKAGAQQWPRQWGAPRAEHQSFDFGSYVTLQGGEYLFAPSINFLKSL